MKKEKYGLGTIAFILGIISAIFFWTPLSIPHIELVISITTALAIVLGAVAISEKQGVTMGVIGLVLGIVVFSLIYFGGEKAGGSIVQKQTTPEVQITPAVIQEQVTPKSTCGDSVCDSDESYSTCPQDCSKIEEVKKIAEEYHKTHTYSLPDLYVCSNMAGDVRNLIETQGISAKICAGNVEKDLKQIWNEKTEHTREDIFEYFNNMNHAWVVAEIEPFTYIAVETTGGYLVWGENATTDEVKNQLYYSGYCFDSQKQFESFIDARTNMLNMCSEAINMENYWNNNYAGRILTTQASEYKGRMNQKEEECLSVENEMKGLLT